MGEQQSELHIETQLKSQTHFLFDWTTTRVKIVNCKISILPHVWCWHAVSVGGGQGRAPGVEGRDQGAILSLYSLKLFSKSICMQSDLHLDNTTTTTSWLVVLKWMSKGWVGEPTPASPPGCGGNRPSLLHKIRFSHALYILGLKGEFLKTSLCSLMSPSRNKIK